MKCPRQKKKEMAEAKVQTEGLCRDPPLMPLPNPPPKVPSGQRADPTEEASGASSSGKLEAA